MIGRLLILLCLLAGGALAAIAVCAPLLFAAPLHRPADDGPADPVPSLNIVARADDPSRITVVVSGLDRSAVEALETRGKSPDRWNAVLIVRVIRKEAAADDDTPPMLGTYRMDGDVLRFEPRFPLEPGVRYRAEFYPGGDRERNPNDNKNKTTAEFSLPERPIQPSVTVTAVYPSRSLLPENLLRFYIHFAAPMSRGEAYRHIRLLDADGKPVADPFLELDEELWSGDGKRFTLLFDPGRIKRGLRPREEVGPVLEAGRSYELVIDPGWTDAAGNPLKSGFRKKFRTGAADETSPDPKTWIVHPPAPGTRDPLEIRFPEPLDRALLDRLIAVRDKVGIFVAGTVDVAAEETVWRFTPAGPWRPGSYRLTVGTELEDVAGNSVARPFEVDMLRPISQRIVRETVSLPFRIESAPR